VLEEIRRGERIVTLDTPVFGFVLLADELVLNEELALSVLLESSDDRWLMSKESLRISGGGRGSNGLEGMTGSKNVPT
jgi:hypothetical protein